jgi:hypothetical protein
MLSTNIITLRSFHSDGVYVSVGKFPGRKHAKRNTVKKDDKHSLL